jgi:hypothetical protein
VSPRALAALRLMISSNLMGRSTGEVSRFGALLGAELLRYQRS